MFAVVAIIETKTKHIYKNMIDVQQIPAALMFGAFMYFMYSLEVQKRDNKPYHCTPSDQTVIYLSKSCVLIVA